MASASWNGSTSPFCGTFFSEATYCAWLALTLNTGAYTLEIISGALRTYPRAMKDAAQALGLSSLQSFWLLKLPVVMRHIIPSYANEAVFLMHATALVSSITVIELTQVARVMNSRFYIPFEAFITAALFYLIISSLMFVAFRYAEKKTAYPK